MIKLLKYFRARDYFASIFVILFVLCQAFLEMELIKYMGEIVGLIQNYASGVGEISTALIWGVGWKMLVNAGLIFLCACSVNFLSSYVATSFAKKLRNIVFSKVNEFSMEEINKFSTASLITRSTNDIKQIEQTVFMTLRMAIMGPFMAVFSIKEILGSSVELTWTTAGALMLMFGLVLVMVFVVVPKFTQIQQKIDKINALTRENLTGLRVIRAYNAETEQQEKFDKANTDLTKTDLFVNRVLAILSPGLDLVMNGLSLAIYWLGAYLININQIEYSSLVTFTQFAMRVLMSFMLMSMLFVTIPRGIVSAKRVNEILDTKIKIKDGEDKTLATETGTIEFKNVSFRYPNAEVDVLENISFKVNKGETIAFIGSTGSGKSTLINLLPRFFDATKGEVLVDGKNVKDYKISELNQKLGFVPQKGYLFSGTVESNLKYGNENATTEEMYNALSIAQASFVKRYKDGLMHPISQGGTNVSGGQRQRLCIARAVVKNPEIYVFDDSFSALDYKTDKILRKALHEKTKDATKVIVAQRIGTIIDADKIVVLDEGKMVGFGNHKYLLENCKVYKEIALSQLDKEEL